MSLNLKEINALANAYDKILTRAGAEAVRFFKQRFAEQNWIDNTTQPWKHKRQGRGNKTLVDTARLKRSIRVIGSTPTRVTIGTDVAYAKIHNEGGKIPITPKMRKFFWAKYMEAQKGLSTDKKGRTRQNARNRTISEKANFYKAMAITKKQNLVIPRRQFLGASQYLDKRLNRILTAEINKAINRA